MAWKHGGADFQSCFDKSTAQAQEMKEEICLKRRSVERCPCRTKLSTFVHPVTDEHERLDFPKR
jgi:hypothetical protein